MDKTTDSTTPTSDPVVGVYSTHGEAESAIKSLGATGFELKKLSIIGKGYVTEEHAVGFYTTGDRVKSWGGIGGFWGAIWGLLAGPSVFLLPQIGLLAVAGPFGLALVAALEGAVVVGALSAIVAALTGLGVAKHQAVKYESDLRADRFLLIVHGTPEDVERARSVLDSVKT